ncbi:MAG: VWA domain-containing protein [Planctomycetota bacterium]|nr:VWA domain-containing protein [Planctomycetota bacterium]
MDLWFLHNPAFLLLLPVLAIPWFDFNKNAKAFPFPGCYLLQDSSIKIKKMRGLSRTSFGACLLLLILGLAQPSKIIKNSTVRIEGLAVEFVLDISGSMAENLILDQGQPISRLNLAKENIRYFLQGKGSNNFANSFKQNYEGRAGDFIGLVAFASRARMIVPLTLDHSAFLSVLDKLEPKKVPGSSETNIADALTLAIDKLQSLPEQRKLILLLTDGEQNVVAPFSGLNPIDLATLAAKLNIAIYTLDVGYPAGDKIFEDTASSEEKEKRRQAQEGLRQLAQMTDGSVLNASDEKSMAEAFQKIGQLEQQSRLSLYSKPVRDFYPWCFFASLFFCGLGIFLAGSRWQRIG